MGGRSARTAARARAAHSGSATAPARRRREHRTRDARRPDRRARADRRRQRDQPTSSRTADGSHGHKPDERPQRARSARTPARCSRSRPTIRGGADRRGDARDGRPRARAAHPRNAAIAQHPADHAQLRAPPTTGAREAGLGGDPHQAGHAVEAARAADPHPRSDALAPTGDPRLVPAPRAGSTSETSERDPRCRGQRDQSARGDAHALAARVQVDIAHDGHEAIALSGRVQYGRSSWTARCPSSTGTRPRS